MKSRKSLLMAVSSFTALLLLILDTKTALTGAESAIQLCLRTVIPSLFPFFVVSTLLTHTLSGRAIPMLSPLCALLGVPRGSESLLLVGLLGGYPVGAQCVANAYEAGSISNADAKRLLGFCNNAGPAFLFGMAGSLFSSPAITWTLWLIHIGSALAVGALLPRQSSQEGTIMPQKNVSLPFALRQAVKSMAEVCGWVTMFRVVIAFCDRWFLWLLPETIRVLLIGLLELSNGCVSLTAISQPGMRFILCALFLAVGGVCVGMQTVSVTNRLGTGMYFPGKLLQGIFSLAAAIALQPILFPPNARGTFSPALLTVSIGAFACALAFLMKREKRSRNPAALHV